MYEQFWEWDVLCANDQVFDWLGEKRCIIDIKEPIVFLLCITQWKNKNFSGVVYRNNSLPDPRKKQMYCQSNLKSTTRNISERRTVLVD